MLLSHTIAAVSFGYPKDQLPGPDVFYTLSGPHSMGRSARPGNSSFHFEGDTALGAYMLESPSGAE